jgi:hypothetical protein
MRTVQFVGQPVAGAVTMTRKLHWSEIAPATPTLHVTIFVPLGKVEPLGGLQMTNTFEEHGLVTVGAG